MKPDSYYWKEQASELLNKTDCGYGIRDLVAFFLQEQDEAAEFIRELQKLSEAIYNEVGQGRPDCLRLAESRLVNFVMQYTGWADKAERQGVVQ